MLGNPVVFDRLVGILNDGLIGRVERYAFF